MQYFSKQTEQDFYAIQNAEPNATMMFCDRYDGDQPDGEARICVRTKKGRIVLSEKGAFQKGVRQGEWEHYDYTGHSEREYVSEKGRYVDGQREGDWQSFRSDGTIKEEATYVGGKKEGMVKTFQQDGDLWMVRAYRNGEKNGPAIDYFYHNPGNPHGIAAEKSYKDGLLNGPCTNFRKPGIVSEMGEYVDGKKDGEWKHFYDDGVSLVSTVTYSADKTNGPFRRYFENGNLGIKGDYDYDKYDGIWEYFNEDGSRKKFFATGNDSDEKTKNLNRELWWLKLGDNAKELFNKEKKDRTAEQRAADQMNKIYEKYPQYKPAV